MINGAIIVHRETINLLLHMVWCPLTCPADNADQKSCNRVWRGLSLCAKERILIICAHADLKVAASPLFFPHFPPLASEGRGLGARLVSRRCHCPQSGAAGTGSSEDREQQGQGTAGTEQQEQGPVLMGQRGQGAAGMEQPALVPRAPPRASAAVRARQLRVPGGPRGRTRFGSIFDAP